MIIAAFPARVIVFRIYFHSSLIVNIGQYSYVQITKQLEIMAVDKNTFLFVCLMLVSNYFLSISSLTILSVMYFV